MNPQKEFIARLEESKPCGGRARSLSPSDFVKKGTKKKVEQKKTVKKGGAGKRPTTRKTVYKPKKFKKMESKVI